MTVRLRDSEKTLQSVQSDISNYQSVMKGSKETLAEMQQQMEEDYKKIDSKYQEALGNIKKMTEKEQAQEKYIKTLEEKIKSLGKLPGLGEGETRLRAFSVEWLFSVYCDTFAIFSLFIIMQFF